MNKSFRDDLLGASIPALFFPHLPWLLFSCIPVSHHPGQDMTLLRAVCFAAGTLAGTTSLLSTALVPGLPNGLSPARLICHSKAINWQRIWTQEVKERKSSSSHFCNEQASEGEGPRRMTFADDVCRWAPCVFIPKQAAADGLLVFWAAETTPSTTLSQLVSWKSEATNNRSFFSTSPFLVC